MKTGPTINKGNSKQDYGTPFKFIVEVEARYGPIMVDLAASGDNKKAPSYLGLDLGLDSLKEDWTKFAMGGLCFLNPPFANIRPWARKCYEEGLKGCKILFLVPSSAGSNWWRDYVHNKAYVNFLNGRITFEGCSDPYVKDLALIQYGFGIEGYGIWKWNK